jgi:oligopeptide transport system substrate-binding protein
VPASRSVLALIAVVATIAGLGGCASAGPLQADRGGTVTVAADEPIEPMLPAAADEAGRLVLDNVLSGLTALDDEGGWQLDAAASIETDDNTRFTVVLQPDGRFTDGEPVTAAAFVDAWDAAALASAARPGREVFSIIRGYSADADSRLAGAGLNVVDDLTFTIETTRPVPDLPERLTTTAFLPLPPSALNDPAGFAAHPIGNGPYLIGDGDWQRGEQIELTASPDYRGSRAPRNAAVVLRFYPDDESAYADLLSGRLDVLADLPDSALGTADDLLDDRYAEAPGAAETLLVVPSDAPHFSGREGRLRRTALSTALDREALIAASAPHRRIPSDDFASPVLAGDDLAPSGARVLRADRERARSTWGAADEYDLWDADDELTLLYPDGPTERAWANAAAAQISEALVIEARAVPYSDPAALSDALDRGETTIAYPSVWMPDQPSIDGYLWPLFARSSAHNLGRSSSDAVEEGLAAAAAAVNPDLSASAADQVQTQLLATLPAIPLWVSAVPVGHGAAVDGVVLDWRGRPILTELLPLR